MATKTMLCAARSGFKLENAKQPHQYARYGRTVPWSDQFVDEMKRGLLACRVMYVKRYLVSWLIRLLDLDIDFRF
jgi:proton-dependent oligopeptide transporter, POT family